MEITRELFDAQRRPRFGTSNPERMQMEFWEWMIRGDEHPSSEDDRLPKLQGPFRPQDLYKAKHYPSRARKRFNVELTHHDGPIWTLQRMGQTKTELSDGRLVCIAGEHEDSYDPDFCIYNDVVVFNPDGSIEIYGYPQSIFPPTDSHSATLIGDRIIVIGRHGYPDDRRKESTPVFAVSTKDFAIASVETNGEAPGWLFEHQAVADSEGVVTVTGGCLMGRKGGALERWTNVEEYELNTLTGRWTRRTNRNWAQFLVRRAEGGWLESKNTIAVPRKNGTSFEVRKILMREALYPTGVEHVVEQCKDLNRIQFSVHGVRVSATKNGRNIEVVIEGDLPDELTWRIAEEVRSNIETAADAKCVLVKR